jgi:beta-glucosidase
MLAMILFLMVTEMGEQMVKKSLFKIILVYLSLIWLSYPFQSIEACCLTQIPSASLPWDYDQAENRKPLTFPQGFLWGAATSAHQTEGNCDNNTFWAWEHSTDEQGACRVQHKSGVACDHWNRYKEDIQLLKKMGANAYRFSIEWSKVELKEGEFDENAIQHYADVCRELRMHGIKPCINLHHYTDPIWFAQKGGFEKIENIDHFVRFATKMIQRLDQPETMWFTFNSPDGYAAKGWLTGATPPGKKDMQLCGTVYAHMLEAHVRIYREAKKLNKETHIGILKNIFQLDPWSPFNPLDQLACSIGTKITDTGFFEFFTKGIFELQVPFKANVLHKNAQAIGALDFIGINYYSHGYMKNFTVVRDPKEIPTDNPLFTIYPEGLYRAIKEVHEKIAKPLNVPMYVTENGIATTDDKIRDDFLRKYLHALAKAIKDGYDVRGYIHWSLMDNYEWGNYTEKYGIYSVDFNSPDLTRSLKAGSQFYLDTIAANR